MINTPEMRFQVDESRKFPVVEEVLERLSRAAPRSTAPTAPGSAPPTAGGCCAPPTPRTSSSPAPRRRTRPGLDRLVAQIDEQLALSGLERGPQVAH